MQAVERLLVYGASGYTAKLFLPRLRAAGIELIIAGRNADKLRPLAAQLDCEQRVFGLGNPAELDKQLAGVSFLLNAAGPFIHTAAPLVDACLRNRVDYLDLSGELGPLSYVASCREFAEHMGVMLLPAVGFDVLPSDCLVGHLSRRLPNAESLTLSISPSNLVSRGSAITLSNHAGVWVQVRRAGKLESMRFRTQTRVVDFGAGRRLAIAAPWGDLVTAYHTTGIPNIEVYFEATAFRWGAVTFNQYFNWMLNNEAARAWCVAASQLLPEGPDERARQRAQCVIVAELTKGNRKVKGRLRTPEAYTFTAEAVVRVLREVAGGCRRPGFHTPAQLLGPDFVLGFPGVTREELE